MQPMAGLFSPNERHPRHPAFSIVSPCRETARLNMRDIPSGFPQAFFIRVRIRDGPMFRPANRIRKHSVPAQTAATKLVNRSP